MELENARKDYVLDIIKKGFRQHLIAEVMKIVEYLELA